jgi:DNA-binding sugar fermentation-stimulating protein
MAAGLVMITRSNSSSFKPNARMKPHHAQAFDRVEKKPLARVTRQNGIVAVMH